MGGRASVQKEYRIRADRPRSRCEEERSLARDTAKAKEAMTKHEDLEETGFFSA